MTPLARLAPWPQTLWFLACSAAATGIATASAWPIYATPRLIALAAGAWLLGTAIALASRALAWRWWVTLPATLLGYVIVAVPLAIPSALASPDRFGRGVAEAAAAVVTSWKRLATVSLPAGAFEAVLVPFLITVLVGSLAAGLLALRGGRFSAWAVLPLLAMAVFGPAFGDPADAAPLGLGSLTVPSGRYVAAALAATGIALGWLVIRARLDRGAALRVARAQATTVRQRGATFVVTLRRQAMGAVIALAAVGVAVAAAPIASSLSPRTALRDEVAPVQVIAAQPSPLSAYRASFESPRVDEVLFTVTGAAGVDRIRIATLDTYDGLTFHVATDAASSRFARQPGTQSGAVTLTIGDGYTGIWVPLATAQGGAPRFLGERAEQLEAAYYASASLDAALVATDTAASGVGLVAGDSYTLAVPASAPGPDSLATAVGGDPLIAAEELPSLAAWVELQQRGRSGADLLELIDRLRERGYLSHSASQTPAAAQWQAQLPGYVFEPARAGHSELRIDALFANLYDQQLRAGEDATPAELVAAVGDDEQFATAAALLARYLGFESRVVVGVRVAEAPGDGPIPACVTECTGANLAAWAEVRDASGAWVPLDATPQYSQLPTRIRQGENPPQNPTVPEMPEAGVIEPPTVQNDNVVTANNVAPDEAASPLRVPRVAVFVASGALAAGLAALPFLVFPAAKAHRRRWRRRATDPEVALVGAWHELMDLYTDFGLEVPQRLTRGETADVLGRDAAASLANVVDWAVFADHGPSQATADAAWRLVSDERQHLASQAGWGRRARAVLTSASLRGGLRRNRASMLSTHSLERSGRAL